MKKIKKIYIEDFANYGRDTNNKNIIIKPFEALRIIKSGDFYTIVKKCGRGQKRKYLIKNDLLKYEV